MKNILIIADGILAKNFLETTVNLKNLKHKYTIVYYNDETISDKIKGENISLHKFDPTSYEKLSEMMVEKFATSTVIMDKELDALCVYENLRRLNEELDIYLLDKWGLIDSIGKDSHLRVIDALSILTSRLVGYLPDHPVLADSIGLGKGEIMEVKVPAGSSFAYKKVGMLQGKFKIPIIYRYNNMVITKYNTMIFPNDTLLVVGEPNVLEDVYRVIKEAKGQFPSPFGINFYLILDMIRLEEDEFKKIMKNAKFLNEKLTNHKLYIRVINPTLSPMLDEVRELIDDDSFEILIEYRKNSPLIMKEDIEKYKVGMVIANNSFFEQYKRLFYNLKTPVLTLGECDVDDLEKGIVLAGNDSQTSEASVIFDLCGQLGLDIYLYYYGEDSDMIKRYHDLAGLFEGKLIVEDDQNMNPYVRLKDECKFLHFVPFNDKILNRKITAGLTKNLDDLYFRLKNNYQLFIPEFYEI
ncbi:MAG: potassium transporter TrkA [Campylobacteraceae bacterium]|nr:potassium transporter TrkA [Campylobacteraceae bacterium]